MSPLGDRAFTGPAPKMCNTIPPIWELRNQPLDLKNYRQTFLFSNADSFHDMLKQRRYALSSPSSSLLVADCMICRLPSSIIYLFMIIILLIGDHLHDLEASFLFMAD